LFVYAGTVDDLTDDLDRAKDELAGLERQLARVSARVAGKRAEVARLEEAIAAEQRSGLPASRTDAIVSVLSRGASPMSPAEVTAALNDAGRADELRSVTATLNHLLKSSRVIRQGRGRYLAT
jgi:recombinational DNA repair ATPase RecF